MRVERVIAVGLAAGLLSGMFGVGGGILIVPGLMWVATMEQRRAHGTSLAAVLPIALFGLVTYVANDHVNVGAAVALIAGSLIGTLLGTAWLARAPKRTLSLGFSAVLVVSAVRLVFEIDGSREHALTIGSAVALVVTGFVAGVLAGLLGIGGGVVMVPAMMLVLAVSAVRLVFEIDGSREHALTIGSAVALVVTGFVAGVLAGLLGIGGGVVMVPAMMLVLGLAPVVAKGTSLAVIVPTAIIGTWRNRRNLNVDVRAGTVVGLAGVGTAVVGGVIADRMNDRLSNLLFALLLVYMAARLLREARSTR